MRREAILLIGCLGLSGCLTGREPDNTPLGSQAVAPVIGWRLPKTVLDTTVTYEPTDCIDGKDSAGADQPTLKANIKVDVVARGVADEALGAAFPDSMIVVQQGDLKSFWIDSNLTYKVYPGKAGILQSLSSHSTGQTGTIIGNFLTGGLKIAAAVAGVPAAGPAPPVVPNKCGRVKTVLADIAKLRALLPTQDGKTAEGTALRIQNLKDSITVTAKRTFDPGRAKDIVTPEGQLPPILPDRDDVIKAGWFSKDAPALDTLDVNRRVVVQLDFKTAALLRPCPAAADKSVPAVCPPQDLEAASLFRQPAYIKVLAYKGDPATKDEVDPQKRTYKVLGTPQVIAFGQYGKGRTLPIKAKAFSDINWLMEFSELGEITTSTYARKATGVGISSTFAGAAGAASSLQQYQVKSESVLDSDILRLQAENSALQAQVTNRELKAKLELQQNPE